ncbi:ABC transporter ATP-binding protein [Hyphobacterium sp. HN65]|uniref:ABC transporter ATP-binding protein n=1 Tax=Hyphobacterium lacteum TaxID=3116575 RepID=A0ABU7LPQ9_9PROT|nr:ABC transporter ATP-binding protein [Hyphobacterium sp. HN65]MEE2525868.1 ABC transporter ATP-binding protein [Hyphobacterium sp. HN65]
MRDELESILEVDGVYKRYARSAAATRKQLSEVFLCALTGRSVERSDHQKDEFWGLRNINFSVNRGQAIGVIGFNGAGKTSLLRVLGGQLLPDRGEVRILGDSASFIDLGAGFNPRLSGRANIFIKGAVLGRSQEEMEAVADDIIAFAELGDFIDAPVNTYSSGMNARLGFAIVTHVDPSLLLIDEILAVGDFHFRQKCLRRVREMRQNSSFVLVSHNMSDVRNFCDEAIVLERGAIVCKGTPEEAIEFYQESESRLLGANQPEAGERFRTQIHGHFVKQEDLVEFEHAYWGTPSGEGLGSFTIGDPVGIHFRFRLKYSPRGLRIGIPVWNQNNIQVTAFASFQKGAIIRPDTDGYVSGFLDLSRSAFNPGEHLAVISVHDNKEFLLRQPLDVIDIQGKPMTQYWGATHMNHEWQGLDFQ